MRYIGLIALINFLVLVVAGIVFGGTDFMSAMLAAFIICAVGIPVAIVLGIPMLWMARRIAVGSPFPLVALGAIAGGLCPIIVSWGAPIQYQMVALGSALGLISAGSWWILVERYPDRRAYYD